MWMYLLLVVLLLAAAAFFLLKFLRNVQPDDTEIEQDLKELKASVAQYKGGFVAWEKGISATDMDQIVEKSNQRSGKGVFLSLDGSPVFAYAFRNYIGPSTNNLIYVISNDHEYVFRTTTKGTEVMIDGNKIGLVRANGTLYDVRNNEVAQVKRNTMTGLNTVMLNNKEVAKIALPENIGKIEAVEITGVDLSAEQKETVKTLSIMELINSQEPLQS